MDRVMEESLDKWGDPVQVTRVIKVFQQMDFDDDGAISPEEFSAVLTRLNPEAFEGKSLEPLFEVADVDRNGKIDLEEFLNFLFLGESKGVYVGDSESDDEVSSSSSEEEAATDSTSWKEAPKLERSRSRSLKNEEPETTPEEMYELLTMRHGYTGGKLQLEDFVMFFGLCKQDGLGPWMAQLVPQECDTPEECSDVLPLDVVHFYILLSKNMEASLKDAKDTLREVEDRTLATDPRDREERRRAIRALGLAVDAPIGFGMFCRIGDFISGIMGLDQAHILAVFAWARTCRFEMPEAMAKVMMENVFLKVPKPGIHLMEQPIVENDFVRMCHAMGILDRKEKKGILPGKVGGVFNKILKHLPRLLLARRRKRYYDRGKLEKNPRKRKHSHKRIRGRTELSILIEELFKAIPKAFAQWGSPMRLACMFLKKGSEGAEQSRLRVRI